LFGETEAAMKRNINLENIIRLRLLKMITEESLLQAKEITS
jgi:hypothetical protein